MKSYKLIANIESESDIRQELREFMNSMSSPNIKGIVFKETEILQNFLVITEDKDFILQSMNLETAKVTAKEIFGSKLKEVIDEI